MTAVQHPLILPAPKVAMVCIEASLRSMRHISQMNSAEAQRAAQRIAKQGHALWLASRRTSSWSTDTDRRRASMVSVMEASTYKVCRVQKTSMDKHCKACTEATAKIQHGLCRHTWVRSKTGSRCTLAQRGPQLRRNIFIQSSYLQAHACIKPHLQDVPCAPMRAHSRWPHDGPFMPMCA